MGRCRWPIVILAALGTVVAHGAAYDLVAPHGLGVAHDAAGVHGYLEVLAPVVVLATLVGMGWLVASRAGGSRRLPSTVALASAQMAVFLLQELVEHAVAGPGMHSALASPAVWSGLVLQAVVAGVLVWLARAGRRAVDRLRSSWRRRPEEALRTSAAGPMGWPALWQRAPRRRRGPPRPRVLNVT